MADDNRLTEFEKEDIPDVDLLYLRVPKACQEEGELAPAAFRDREPPKGAPGEPGMSTHWSRYATPKSAHGRSRHPERTGVVRMIVGEVRAIPRLTVQHTPTADDRSHTDVFGPKDTESRLRLTRCCEWVIPIPE